MKDLYKWRYLPNKFLNNSFISYIYYRTHYAIFGKLRYIYQTHYLFIPKNKGADGIEILL